MRWREALFKKYGVNAFMLIFIGVIIHVIDFIFNHFFGLTSKQSTDPLILGIYLLIYYKMSSNKEVDEE